VLAALALLLALLVRRKQLRQEAGGG
jgi:hypothetical protein